MEQVLDIEKATHENAVGHGQKEDLTVSFVESQHLNVDHKDTQFTVKSMASIGFPELLNDDEVEVEHENVQMTVRSMAEYCTEFKKRNDRAVALVWEDISVTTADGEKVLLKNASGMVKSRFLAIMGPSGSGKTTLMNVLARRMAGAKMNGMSKINGVPYSNSELKALSGYVMQDDLLNGNLTVQETLDYTAELRLPSSMTALERKERVDEALKKVGLDHCRKTLIGTPTIKGVSGGERKRVCVAMELLTHPRLLFLDEPTSGLDSVTALSCNYFEKLKT
jgi:ABC-type Mn2+/Zn2+ transport system ATPase subunit